MTRKTIIFLFCIATALLFQASCDSGSDLKRELQTDNDPLEFSFTRGGAPIKVIVRLSKNELELTDFLTVTIESQFKEGVLVTPPYLSESVYSPLLLVENPLEETLWSEKQEVMINRWTYKFEPLVSGDFKLNPFTIYFRLEKEKNQEEWPVYQVNTEAISYKVTRNDISELSDIRDIKGLIYPPYNYWIPGITILVLGLIGAGTFLLFRFKRANSQKFNNTQELIDYYTEAINRLHTLEQRDYISKEEFNSFHTELTSILRDYLEHHFGLRAKEQTTQEFIQEIVQTRKFTKAQRHELNRFLQLADLVKFATFQPGTQNSEEALNNVRAFIKSTGKPHEV